ncbi:MAG: hypothetical protein AB7P33_10870 [Dehalococcoidia bacterium]
MTARLVAFLLWLSLALTLGCTTEASTEPTPSPTTSPAAAIFAPPPSPTLGPATSLVLPLAPTPHSLGARTGIAKVDAVIAAYEARDAAALNALIAFYAMPCTDDDAIGAVACPVGAMAGTPVEVFGYGTCEGAWITRSDPALPALIPGYMVPPRGAAVADARVYAVIQGRLFPEEPVPGDAVIVYNSGLVMGVNQQGLTYISAPCGATGSQWLEQRIARLGAQSYVLAPVK